MFNLGTQHLGRTRTCEQPFSPVRSETESSHHEVMRVQSKKKARDAEQEARDGKRAYFARPSSSFIT